MKVKAPEMSALYSEDTPEKPMGQEPMMEEEDTENSDVVVSKATLPPGVKVGDTVTFTVSADHGNEMTLSPAQAPSDDKEIDAMDDGADSMGY